MARLSVYLLGPLQVTLDGQPIAGFESDKVRALLAYLVADAGRPHRREVLAGLLWPDCSQQSARASLRRALANLRQVIDESHADYINNRRTKRWIRQIPPSDSALSY